MAVVVRNLRLGLDQSEDVLTDLTAKRLKVPRGAIRDWHPVRRSLDARDREDVHFVYHVELTLDGGPGAERAALRRAGGRNVDMVKPQRRHDPMPGARLLPHRPTIVGFGPAGMFAALRLAEYGYQPIVLERGRDVDRRGRDVREHFYGERRLDPESNLLFGEGGAGTYSDGKLYTRVSDALMQTVMECLVRDGADRDILVDARPHLGSDKLPAICGNIRRRIESAGGEIRFESRLDDVEVDEGQVAAIRVNGERIEAGPVVLAVGHSARDTIRMVSARGVRLEAKPFQFGVRIEHRQEQVDRWQYGALAGHDRLPPAEYHLVAKEAAGTDGDLFSFCMCPGGHILPTNESPGLIATNGASQSSRNGPFANAGLVITLGPATIGFDPLYGLDYLERWERLAFKSTNETYEVPAQRASDYLDRRESDGVLETTYPFGGQWRSIRYVVPRNVGDALDRGLRMLDDRLPGFAGDDSIITAPETRASSPVRIVRDNVTRQSPTCSRLYPCGEGAGYAGGIISAAVDGIKTADAIINEYAVP
ncbi:MAG: hypothetical protein JSV19_10875 [Phycisphaerales bacterium]|nr:MAG: hypothetical protein JSV19_10875 [Phycisphaerales bacterium]